MPIGYQFQPDEERRLRANLNRNGASPTAEALRVLSLRLPTVLGGHPISPEDILRSRSMGAPPAPTSRPPSSAPNPTLPGATTAPGTNPFVVLSGEGGTPPSSGTVGRPSIIPGDDPNAKEVYTELPQPRVGTEPVGPKGVFPTPTDQPTGESPTQSLGPLFALLQRSLGGRFDRQV